jgi:hypothetical protein
MLGLENDREMRISQVLSGATCSSEAPRSLAECSSLPAESLLAMSHGWLLFPVVGRANSNCSEIQRASGDLTQLGRWAEDFPGCRWAVRLGPQSGVFVIEADPERCLLRCRPHPVFLALSGRNGRSFQRLGLPGPGPDSQGRR